MLSVHIQIPLAHAITRGAWAAPNHLLSGEEGLWAQYRHMAGCSDLGPLALFTGLLHPSEPLQTFEEGLGCSPVVTECLQVVLANKTPALRSWRTQFSPPSQRTLCTPSSWLFPQEATA